MFNNEALEGQMQEERKQKNGSGSSINYRAVFTGEVMVRPIMFNPTKQDLIKIKNMTNEKAIEGMNEPVYTDIKLPSGKTITKISLLASFNPYAPMHPYAVVEATEDVAKHGTIDMSDPAKTLVYVHESKKLYPDTMFVNYDIIIGKNKVVSEKTGKSLIMDDKNLSVWVKINEGETVEQAVRRVAKEDALNNESKYRDLHNINPVTARVTHEGEIDFYNLLFAMAGRLEPYRMKDGKAAGVQGNFVFGKEPSQAFLHLCEGGQSVLNAAIINKSKEETKFFRMDNGDLCKVGVMLVVKVADTTDADGNPYLNQLVFTKTRVPSAAKYSAFSRKVVGEEKSFLDKEVFAVLNSTDYPYPFRWSYGFKEFQQNATKQVESGISQNIAGMADDLPF